MTGTIFMGQLRNSWKQILYWGLGIAFLMFYVLSVVQSADVLEQYQQVLGAMPPAILSAFGLSEIETLGKPEGFVAFGGMNYGIMILAVFAVMSGLNITANDEDEGILDVMLALPVARWRVILEKFLAYTVIIVGILAIAYLGIIGGRMAVPQEIPLDMIGLFAGTFNMLPMTLAMMAVTTLFASAIGRKRIVIALATVYIVASYFIFTVAGATDNAAFDLLDRFSVFHYFNAEQTVLSGLRWEYVAVLLTATIVALLASLVTFERRDINLG